MPVKKVDIVDVEKMTSITGFSHSIKVDGPYRIQIEPEELERQAQAQKDFQEYLSKGPSTHGAGRYRELKKDGTLGPPTDGDEIAQASADAALLELIVYHKSELLKHRWVLDRLQTAAADDDEIFEEFVSRLGRRPRGFPHKKNEKLYFYLKQNWTREDKPLYDMGRHFVLGELKRQGVVPRSYSRKALDKFIRRLIEEKSLRGPDEIKAIKDLSGDK